MILYIYCAGGFGKEVMDVARRQNAVSGRWSTICFVDDILSETHKYGARVVKFNSILGNGSLENCEFVIANGEPIVRHNILNKLEEAGAHLGSVIDVSTLVSDTAVLQDGVVITPLCSISSNAVLERNACVNTMSIVGHDVHIGSNSVVSSMVNIGGACMIGSNTYIGMGALIKEGICIGSNVIIGMGSVVYNDIPDNTIALGNPARPIRRNEGKGVFRK